MGVESTINNRTSSNRCGCPACAGRVVTPTNNLAVWCGEHGRNDLLEEWAHPDKAPRVHAGVRREGAVEMRRVRVGLGSRHQQPHET